MSNFIPNTDGDFSVWANHLANTLKADPAGYGVSVEEATEFAAKVSTWDTTLADQFDKREAAKSATIEKDQARKAAEEFARELNRQIQGDKKISDAKKQDAGLPVHKTSRTPMPVPTSAPLATIEPCNVREHFLRFSDSTNPHSRVRPKGVFGVEVWFACGDEQPVEDDQYQMYTMATRMSATVVFSADQAGKSVWYRFRFVNTRGEVGPWSMVYTSTITK